MGSRGVVRRVVGLVACTAVLSVGFAATALPSGAAPPSAPTGVAAVAGPLSAQVSWIAPADGGSPLTGYRVFVGQPGSLAPGRLVDVSAAATTTTIADFNPGRYFFLVAAINADGTGPYSASSGPIDIGPGAPFAPAQATVVSVGPTSAVVSWFLPDDGGSPITGYTVTPDIAGVPQPAQAFASTGRTQTVTGLTVGLTYRFRVSATNALGTGPPSGPTAVVTTGAPSSPRSPLAVPGPTSAVVSWLAPLETNGAAVTGYEVTASFVGGGTARTVTFPSTDRTQTIDLLDPGTAYVFRVAAINARGTGLASTGSPPLRVGSPSPPTGVTAVAGSLSATVSWAPAADNGAPVTGQRVLVGVPGSIQPVRIVAVGPGATSAVITGLAAGRRHFFLVAATNSRGDGPFGASSGPITVGVGVPSAPTAVSAVVGEASATVSWTPGYDGGSPITGYVVTPEIAGVPQPSQTFPSTATTQTVVGLTQGASYRFRVAGINAGGTGALSSPSAAIVVGVPGPPRTPVATPGTSPLTLSWQAPLSDHGSAITGYVVTPYRSSVAQAPITFLSPALTQSLTGLTPGGYYEFTVAAINEHGTGAPSLRSPGLRAGAPAAPTGVTAVAGVRSATVSWVAPADNGSPITGYRIWVGVPGVVVARIVTVGPVTTATVTGLTPGQPYFFLVAADNANGPGPYSTTPSPRVTPTA